MPKPLVRGSTDEDPCSSRYNNKLASNNANDEKVTKCGDCGNLVKIIRNPNLSSPQELLTTVSNSCGLERFGFRIMRIISNKMLLLLQMSIT